MPRKKKEVIVVSKAEVALNQKILLLTAEKDLWKERFEISQKEIADLKADFKDASKKKR